MGSFADNMGSFMTGLTGKILQEKETQDKIKIDNDKAALGMKLNLFGDMLGNPDKYSANDLQLMGSTILKDHKLPQVFPGAEEYVQQLIQGRQNDVKTYKDNENLKQMFPGDPNSLSPAQVNAAYASLFSEGRADARADKTYKLQSEARLAERQYLDEAARKENEENWKRHRETQADLRGVEWRRGIASGYEAEQNRITELERAKIAASAQHNQKIPLAETHAMKMADAALARATNQMTGGNPDLPYAEQQRIWNTVYQGALTGLFPPENKPVYGQSAQHPFTLEEINPSQEPAHTTQDISDAQRQSMISMESAMAASRTVWPEDVKKSFFDMEVANVLKRKKIGSSYLGLSNQTPVPKKVDLRSIPAFRIGQE